MNIQVSHLQTITTKFIPATNTKGSRIAVTTGAGKRKYYPWDYSLGIEANHIEACRNMVEFMGWDFGQNMIGGSTETGYVFVGYGEIK